MRRVLLQFWVTHYDDDWIDYLVSQQLSEWTASDQGRYALSIGCEPWWRSTETSRGLRVQVLAEMSDAQYTLYLVC